jgi:hypothetical protein
MDNLMAENIMKIIKTAKWDKSHQKKFLKKTAQVLVRVRIKKYCELRYCDTAILHVTAFEESSK